MIFDGLDELLDTSLRRSVSMQVESQGGSTRTLPFPATLPVPARFRDLFQAWVRREVNFAEIEAG